jgi:heparan-alpha-glucosaminide N-acetyltransferase
MTTTVESAAVAPPAPGEIGAAPARLASIDAYRGFVMFLMMAEVLELSEVAAAKPGSVFWHFLAHHQTHAPWTGCSLHDLIQPSFSFLVGVALPFSLASRQARGESRWRMTRHAVCRAVVLVLLGVFLRSIGHPQTYWTFEDTLSQIGLGYVALFLLGFRPVREQWLAFGLILVGYWAAFALYSLPGPDFDYTKVGVARDWPELMTGFVAHWNKNSNLAWAFDTWFLNLFPREKPFLFNGGGYATLSFIPTLATMILGLIAGGVLRGQRAPEAKVKWFLAAGVAGLLAGSALGWLGVCPVVKRIWTPSWVLFSGGWCFLLLAAFYGMLDIWHRKAWAFPFILAGANSIAAYCSAQLFDGFIVQNLERHFGPSLEAPGSPGVTLLRGALVLLVLWALLFWMYRRKIFLRI